MEKEIEFTSAQAATALGITYGAVRHLARKAGVIMRDGPRNTRLILRYDLERMLGRVLADHELIRLREVKCQPTGKLIFQRRIAKASHPPARIPFLTILQHALMRDRKEVGEAVWNEIRFGSLAVLLAAVDPVTQRITDNIDIAATIERAHKRKGEYLLQRLADALADEEQVKP